MRSFGRTLAAAIEAAGIDRATLATTIDMDSSNLSLWINGKRTPSMRSVDRLKRALPSQADEIQRAWEHERFPLAVADYNRDLSLARQRIASLEEQLQAARARLAARGSSGEDVEQLKKELQSAHAMLAAWSSPGGGALPHSLIDVSDLEPDEQAIVASIVASVRQWREQTNGRSASRLLDTARTNLNSQISLFLDHPFTEPP